MPTAEKIDLYKIHKAEYVATKKPALVKTRPAQYLTISGHGAPASPEFQEKVGTLYSVAFTLKMAQKFAGKDYKVCNLEGLYWGSREEENEDALILRNGVVADNSRSRLHQGERSSADFRPAPRQGESR